MGRLPDGWSQNGAGQAQVVSLLPGLLQKMLGRKQAKPDFVFTDRGPGYYHSATGNIDPTYFKALHDQGFKPWAGEHGKWQPPDIADWLPHETAVAWIRKYAKRHPIKWSDSLSKNKDMLKKQLADAVEHCNTQYDVEGLCKSVPKRLKALVGKEGGRLKW